MSRLKIWFVFVLVAMLVVTTWASSHVALWDMPRTVVTHPWFIATLFDCYFAFLAFWLWLAWRERTWVARLSWLGAILLTGNIAMAAYVLYRLTRIPPGGGVPALLMRDPA